MTKLDVNKAYGSSGFLNGDELHAQLERDGVEELILTIAGFRSDTKDNPWITSFLEVDEELRLKKANARALVFALGDDTDKWPSNKVALSCYFVDFIAADGKHVEAWVIKLRVLPNGINTYAAATGAGQPMALSAGLPPNLDLDDTIPFTSEWR